MAATQAVVTEAHFFEGTEKRIELDFFGQGDLRQVAEEGWREVVRLSGTQILHRKETSEFVSFLLSESSLIVYPAKVILKTCGRTVPICSVEKVMSLARSAGMEPEWLCYSRKDFLAPSAQPEEHQSQEAEIAMCRKACSGVGDAYILGPVTGDHWLIYDAQYLWTDCINRGDFQVDVMMYDLPKDVQEVFVSKEPQGSVEGASTMTRASGLGDVAASIGGEVDDYCFSPCGYSCNMHAGRAYAMVHVTPQDGCSYASFETNFGSRHDGVPDEDVHKLLNELVGKVLDVFRPNKLTITLFADGGAVSKLGDAPFGAADQRYRKRNCTITNFEQDYRAVIANYVQIDRKRRLESSTSDTLLLAGEGSPPAKVPMTCASLPGNLAAGTG